MHGKGAWSSQQGGTRAPTGWPPSRGFPTRPTPAFTNYSGQYDKLGELSENVLDLMLQAPDDRLREATFDLLAALTSSGAPVLRGAHLLCQLFEEVAVGLQANIDAPNAVIDQLVGQKAAGSRVVAAAVRVLLKRAAALALAQAMAPLSVLHLQACACALAFCPDTTKHSSLEKNCGLPLFQAAATADE